MDAISPKHFYLFRHRNRRFFQLIGEKSGLGPIEDPAPSISPWKRAEQQPALAWQLTEGDIPVVPVPHWMIVFF
jgi:hypothetical protein